MTKEEAIQKIREWDFLNEEEKEALETICPELAESEDEKIRKGIISNLDNMIAYIEDYECSPKVRESAINDIKKQKTWLERQKPTTDIQNLTWEDIEKIGEFINIVQYENPNGIGAKCLYTDVLERFLDGKQTKQKAVEWSEEDETALQDALWCIEQARKQAKDENDMGTCWFAERWLKSLKPQNNWKPSSQHIAALEYQVNTTCRGSWQYKASKELLEQLKKL